MAITAFIYGCIGLTFGSVLIYYIMISGEYKSWPMNIGGKPNFTFFKNLPSFVPVLFELTVMFAGHLMSLTYFYRCKLFPGSQETSPDPRTTDDKFLVEIEHKNFKEVEKFFETMPKLSHTLKVLNPKTNVESDVVLEGLASFFG